ncbi:MAG: type IV toxin-antitoxin system AbiEi family antitoxin domain-containing protein [Acidobacteria bacterium]|nr:type IV toxin-antitoxin system AbiEi family antitoxin domain-containing protein [Acidobacteriota bacterium]
MRSRLEELLPLAEQNDGLVTASQARALGITDSVLARLTQRGKLERVARGVYRIPYFPADRLSQYREAVLWARASQGPERVALSHETALGVYGISDVNPSRVHLTVPRNARLRRRKPKWIVIHRGDLAPSDVTTHEGLPVTTVGKSVLDVMEVTGRLGLARQAIKDARKEGYISAAELNRLTRQLNQQAHGGGAEKEHATG